MRVSLIGGVIYLCINATAWSQEKTEVKPLTLIDAAGKELTLKNWKFATGTKHLSWLDPKADVPVPKGKKGSPVPPTGPEFLEFREKKLEMYKDDVSTFIPLTSLKRIDYDLKAKEVSVTLLASDGKDLTLRGTTEYVGINKYNLDGEIDAGALQVGGPVKLQDGFLRAGIKSIVFADAKPAPQAVGSKAQVVTRGKEKTKHDVMDLQPVYKVGTRYRLVPALTFQKTVKIDLNDLARLTHLPRKDKKGGLLDFNVEKRDGSKQGLTLLDKLTMGEKESAVLAGLVGRVSAGYRIFPATIIAEVTWTPVEK